MTVEEYRGSYFVYCDECGRFIKMTDERPERESHPLCEECKADFAGLARR